MRPRFPTPPKDLRRQVTGLAYMEAGTGAGLAYDADGNMRQPTVH